MKRWNGVGEPRSANVDLPARVPFPVTSEESSSPGLRWIVMAVVVTLPWTPQKWALPFVCVLATTPEVSEKLGKRHKTVGMWARAVAEPAAALASHGLAQDHRRYSILE